jgi:CP family cyanate transporter-like MFS transporter
MGLGAAVAAGTSVPLATAFGWRGSLAFWTLPAVVGLLVWLPQLKGSLRTKPTRSVGAALHALGRSPLAWQIALFMGLQSLTFYVVLAWLPDLLQSRGLGAAEAGWLLALSQAAGIAGSAVVPAWAGRRSDQRAIIAGLGAVEVIAIGGLFLPDGLYAAFWVSLLGFVLGATFGLALLFLVLRTPDTETATELSGMAQSAGYLLAAVGPAGFGFLRDVSGSWTIPLLLLLGIVAAKTLVGFGAGKPGVIERDA